MAQTSLTLTRDTVEQIIPATFSGNRGFFSIQTANWTPQMFYELPSIVVELYIDSDNIKIKTPLFSRVIKTYDERFITAREFPYTIDVENVPENCYLKIIPYFDNNALPARNTLIENGLEEGELWETSTTQFPIILSIGEEAGGTEQTIEGQPPISFISTTTSLIDWTLYGNSIQNGTPTPTSPKPVLGCGDYYETEPELKTLTGVPPFTINTDGTSIETWSLDGNSQQTGTPTPDNPIMPTFCGVRTGNLFFTAGESEGKYISISGTIEDGYQWYASDYIPVESSATYTFNPNSQRGASGKHAFYSSDKSFISYVDSGPQTFTTPANAAFMRFSYRYASYDIMLNLGTTALPYEPYGYKIPITSAGQTTPVYLGQVSTVRKIMKLVLDGTETGWIYPSAGVARLTLPSVSVKTTGTDNAPLSTHYIGRFSDNTGSIRVLTDATKLNIADTVNAADSTTWTTYLAAQYAAGTPVTVWYVLAEPEAAIVNEPLAKIGTYADTFTSEQAGITLPTIKGTTTVTVDTTTLPSNMSITYYEQFQKYIIPITNRSNTQTIDLSAVQSNRKIKKLVLTGEETMGNVATPDANRTSFLVSIPGLGMYNTPGICSHFEWKASYASTEYNRIMYNASFNFYMSLDNTLLSEAGNIDAVQAYFAAQYTAGTPVTIWYVLTEPETGTINEPLMKIGDYADVLESENAGITIPIQKGLNTVDVNTTLKPSNIKITYK